MLIRHLYSLLWFCKQHHGSERDDLTLRSKDGLPVGGLGLTDTQTSRRVCALRSGSESGGIRTRGIEDGSWLEGQGLTEKNTKRSIPGRLGRKDKE